MDYLIPLLLSESFAGCLFEHIRSIVYAIIDLVGYYMAPYIKKTWMLYAILIEQIVLGGLSFGIPVQPIQPKGNYQQIDAPLLHVPGMFPMPAGKSNPARKRYQEILLAQMQHEQPLFNRVI